MPTDDKPLPILDPNLQISFYYRLESIRTLFLHQALQSAVEACNLKALDQDLQEVVDGAVLRRVAGFGLRGEVLFATATLLRQQPTLLGYYRLLLGFSQKEFYGKGRYGRFKRMEEAGEIPAGVNPLIEEVCRCLAKSTEKLVGIMEHLSLDLIHELQLLTLGPQLRGSENTRLGQAATQEVYDLIRSIVLSYLREETKRTMILENDSGRKVLVQFASDPDITIVEKLTTGVRPLVSIEIKGGGDVSNVHNRIGEAEKSHQKAKSCGFFEFWTIVRASISEPLAKKQSPTTSLFFNLDQLLREGTGERTRFRDTLSSMIGIRG